MIFREKRMKRFVKAHACGNDFLIVEDKCDPELRFVSARATRASERMGSSSWNGREIVRDASGW